MNVCLTAPVTSLERSTHGTISGQVWLVWPDASFPEEGWSDLIIGVVLAFAEATTKIRSGQVQETVVYFLDGPFSVHLSSASPEQLGMRMCRRDDTWFTVVADLDEWIDSVRIVARSTVARCHELGWRSSELDKLESLVRVGDLS